MKMLRLLGAIGGINLAILPIYAAETALFDGIWFGNGYSGGYLGDYRVYTFLPNGKVQTKTEGGRTDEGAYTRNGNQIQIRFPNQSSYNNRPLVISGEVENELILATGRIAQYSWPVKLGRVPSCEGKRVTCGGGVFCLSEKEKATYWRPDVKHRAGATLQGSDDFSEFYDFFNCAVQLRQHSMYVPRIKFPFHKVLLEPGEQRSSSVSRDGFDVRMINPEEDESVFPPGGRSIPRVTADRTSVYRRWGGPRDTEMEWVFEKNHGQWFLSGAEYHGEAGEQLPWFQLKNCVESKLKGFENAKPEEDEDFEAFVIGFYCALKYEKSDMYLPRIKFPLPYTLRDTEATKRGRIKKDDLKAWEISAVDGGEVPLSYHHTKDRGQAYIGSHSAGTSHRWSFQRVKRYWYLVAVDINSY